VTESNVVRPSVAEAAQAPPAVTSQAAGAGSRLAWLDVLRGIAALAVVFDHFGGFIPARIQNPVYAWINPGNYGVFVFFIISGYIVPASLERKGSVRTFWVSRLFRLYPLYLFAIGFAMLLWAIHFGDLRGEDADPETSVLSQLLMMSNVLGGINLPNVVWSLSYEMVFYLLLTALFMARIHRPSSRYALAFGIAALAIGGILPRAYLIDNLSTPRLIAFAADLAVLAGLAFAVAMRGMSRLVGAILAAMVGLTLLAFNGTWLWPWQALSILSLMFTGTMLYRAERGDYPWRKAIPIAIGVLGLIIVAGLWHSHEIRQSAQAEALWERQWIFTLLLAGASFGVGLAFRHVRWPRFLSWLGLISYSVYLLHPQLITIYYHYRWLRRNSFWHQIAVDAMFVAILIVLSSLTYLLVERPAQKAGRRLSRWLDARFGPDQPPERKPVAREPALAATSRAAAELSGMLVSWLLCPVRAPARCRPRASRARPTASAWSAWGTSAGLRWPRRCCARRWPRPASTARSGWTARAPATGTSASRCTRRPGRPWPGVATTARRTGPGRSSRPGWPDATWCWPWTPAISPPCAGWPGRPAATGSGCSARSAGLAEGQRAPRSPIPTAGTTPTSITCSTCSAPPLRSWPSA
jgi:peptidoglycan/LPS O-acetylase OafA/YrhL